jgi:hypothetical protein
MVCFLIVNRLFQGQGPKRIFFLRKSQSRFTFESYPLKKTDFKTKTCPFLIISKYRLLEPILKSWKKKAEKRAPQANPLLVILFLVKLP